MPRNSTAVIAILSQAPKSGHTRGKIERQQEMSIVFLYVCVESNSSEITKITEIIFQISLRELIKINFTQARSEDLFV